MRINIPRTEFVSHDMRELYPAPFNHFRKERGKP
nr:MAG TPA: hypothetical protein [Caudoviricetes sp.]